VGNCLIMGSRLRLGLAIALLLCVLAAPARAFPPPANPLPPTPAGPDPFLRQWPSWPYPVTCGGEGFDPLVAFSGAVGVESGSRPGEVALRHLVHNREYASIFEGREQGWRLASESPGEAWFLWGRLPYVLSTGVREVEGRWVYAGSSYGCTPISVLAGGPAVHWEIVRPTVLRKETRRIWINLYGPGCEGRQSLNERAKVRFHQFGKKLMMAVGVEPGPPTPFLSCAPISGPPLEAALPGRLGKRALFNARTYPPQHLSRIAPESE
jgi:hypothetical protein